MSPSPRDFYTPPNAFLYGSYAGSHSGFAHAFPPYKTPAGQKPVAQIPGYIELSAPTTNPAKPGVYEQVEGYVPTAFAGFYNFHGDGQLHGSGMVSIGRNIKTVQFNGTYKVLSDHANGLYSGTFQTMDVGSTVALDYFFVMADDWRELKFIITRTGLRQMSVSGTLIRVRDAR